MMAYGNYLNCQPAGETVICGLSQERHMRAVKGELITMNNATIFHTDRNTHVKVLALALIASIVVCLVAINGHVAPNKANVAPSKASGLYSGPAHPISQTATRT